MPYAGAFGHWFGTAPQFWLNLQSAWEIRIAEEKAGREIAGARGPHGVVSTYSGTMEFGVLGFSTAKAILSLGRSSFFLENDDLPQGRSELLQRDDLIPSFGFVGSNYDQTRVLLLGINPGNGPRDDRRTPGDERMMPALHAFAELPTIENFKSATEAYKAECWHWPIWKRHCAEVIGSGKLSLDEITYSNCLPWRTASKSGFSEIVAARAATLYVKPLLDELKPRLVVALGKRAGAIVQTIETKPAQVLIWNRAQAATLQVRQERADTARKILTTLDRDHRL